MLKTSRRSSFAALSAACGLLAMLVVSSGCMNREATAENQAADSQAGWFEPSTKVPAGTPINVRLTSTISSETAKEGSGWTGVTEAPVIIDDKVVFASGSVVHGTVASAVPAERGSRAVLDLRVDRVDSKRVPAGSEPVIAGSPRARNLGAIAGGAAAGALIGKAVGGDGKDAAIGGIIGGAAATGAVAASKGYQVVLKEGTVMTFTTNEQVAVR